MLELIVPIPKEDSALLRFVYSDFNKKEADNSLLHSITSYHK